MNNDRVTGLLEEILTELRGIREALEGEGYEDDDEEGEDEVYEGEDDEE